MVTWRQFPSPAGNQTPVITGLSELSQFTVSFKSVGGTLVSKETVRQFVALIQFRNLKVSYKRNEERETGASIEIPDL
jgi:hypothetical protein